MAAPSVYASAYSLMKFIQNSRRKNPRKFIFWCTVCIILLLSLFIYLFLPYNPALDIQALCHINRKVPSLSTKQSFVTKNRTVTDNHAHLSSVKQTKNLMHFSILTFADQKAIRRYGKSMASLLESRSLYADLHGYHLKAYFHKPEERRKLVWSKITAINDILFQDWEYNTIASQNSGQGHGDADETEHWLWALDVDSLIFDYSQNLESFIEKWINVQKNKTVDLIIACDQNGINAGSFFIRKSSWTKTLLQKWWLRTDERIKDIDCLFEQAALADLIQKDPEVSRNVQIVPQRALNSYGHPAYESWELFQTGDFVVHFPGPDIKKFLPSYVKAWEKMMHDCKLRELWMDAGLPFEHTQLL